MPLPDLDSIDTYNGPKKNYGPVVDPDTDEDAVGINRLKATVAMGSRTAIRALLSFVGATGANPTDPVSGFIHDAVWGNLVGVKATVVRTSAGIWTATFPLTVNSALTSAPIERGGGVTHPVNFRGGWANVENDSASKHDASVRVTAPNVVEVRGWLSNTIDDCNGKKIIVFLV